jgi:pimeloyl-ACP methyl ester carboxylesterase
MPSALINGVRLYWQLTGQGGEVVVLVHGSWIDHRNWDGIVPALGQSFRVLTYDRRGHSQSETLLPSSPDGHHTLSMSEHSRALPGGDDGDWQL